MARRPRGLITNSFLHVTAKGNRGVAIFLDDDDRRFFLDRLRVCVQRHTMRVHAFCLMTNHIHLLVEVQEMPISQPMQALLQVHAQYVNRRYGHRGHLFADRFWSEICRRHTYLLELLRYIHLNPVRAGLATSPELYRWSSHRAYLGMSSGWVTTTLLELFGRHRPEAMREYALFIGAGVPVRPRAGPYE